MLISYNNAHKKPMRVCRSESNDLYRSFFSKNAAVAAVTHIHICVIYELYYYRHRPSSSFFFFVLGYVLLSRSSMQAASKLLPGHSSFFEKRTESRRRFYILPTGMAKKSRMRFLRNGPCWWQCGKKEAEEYQPSLFNQ